MPRISRILDMRGLIMCSHLPCPGLFADYLLNASKWLQNFVLAHWQSRQARHWWPLGDHVLSSPASAGVLRKSCRACMPPAASSSSFKRSYTILCRATRVFWSNDAETTSSLCENYQYFRPESVDVLPMCMGSSYRKCVSLDVLPSMARW